MSRELEDLDHEVFPDVLFTIGLLTDRYQAVLVSDSGHKEAPVRIYRCPNHGGAEVALRLNKESLTLYLQDRVRGGGRLSDLLPDEAITGRYPGEVDPVHSLKKSASLWPSTGNPVIRVNPTREEVQQALAAYLEMSAHSVERTAEPEQRHTHANSTVPGRGRRIVSAEDFQIQLDRRAEVGAMGEGLAVLHEMDRLRQCGCPAPEQYVQRVALTDVGRGYDIESTWPGKERCIEVKTTTISGSDFFITQNEWEVLAQLGGKAWIYRVVLDAAGSEQIKAIGPDPISLLSMPSLHVSPVVWRVAEEAFEPE